MTEETKRIYKKLDCHYTTSLTIFKIRGMSSMHDQSQKLFTLEVRALRKQDI